MLLKVYHLERKEKVKNFTMKMKDKMSVNLGLSKSLSHFLQAAIKKIIEVCK